MRAFNEQPRHLLDEGFLGFGTVALHQLALDTEHHGSVGTHAGLVTLDGWLKFQMTMKLVFEGLFYIYLYSKQINSLKIIKNGSIIVPLPALLIQGARPPQTPPRLPGLVAKRLIHSILQIILGSICAEDFQ